MAFLESVFERDFLWNFRSVSNTKNLFRSPDPARYQNEQNYLTEFLHKNQITAVIDLRGPRERARAPYCEGMLEGLKIECILVDFNEPPVGEKEPGYVKKLIYQKEAIITTIRTIIQTSGATLFHCASGKDRTGVMAALLQKIAGVSEESIFADYIASGHDARPQRIRDVLHYLKKIGGVENFIETLEIDPEDIKKLRNKIMLV
jgi:protein-tyrosine phosphatase